VKRSYVVKFDGSYVKAPHGQYTRIWDADTGVDQSGDIRKVEIVAEVGDIVMVRLHRIAPQMASPSAAAGINVEEGYLALDFAPGVIAGGFGHTTNSTSGSWGSITRSAVGSSESHDAIRCGGCGRYELNDGDRFPEGHPKAGRRHCFSCAWVEA
jgi:hypothetical protein